MGGRPTGTEHFCQGWDASFGWSSSGVDDRGREAPLASSDPWWSTNQELAALRRAALADLQRGIDEREPGYRDKRDPVLTDLWNGASNRELIAAREDLTRARVRYDDAVLAAREAGLSWAEIGVLLGVSKQQLHRQYRARIPLRDLSD